MRFSGISGRGYSLMAVCGSKFDPALLPSPPDLPFRHDPEVARAAIKAVQRARLISYIERGILPKSAFRHPETHADPRDESCIHLILHRENCMLGAIRCQFHRKTRLSGDPEPLFREIMARSDVPESIIQDVEVLMSCPMGQTTTYMETSGWVMNPDLPKSFTTGILLPAAVWGLGAAFQEFHGIATLRASNSAAATLARLGGEVIRVDDKEMRFDDAFYRGSVQLMRMRSLHYTEEIEFLVRYTTANLCHNGILII